VYIIQCRFLYTHVIDFLKGEESEIFRGVWFYDRYEPYEYGEEVEREHLNLFRDDTRKIEDTEDNGKSGINVFCYLTIIGIY